MFRLTEPSSGQFTNHIEGTFSSCALPYTETKEVTLSQAGDQHYFTVRFSLTPYSVPLLTYAQVHLIVSANYNRVNLINDFGSPGQRDCKWCTTTECTFNMVCELA